MNALPPAAVRPSRLTGTPSGEVSSANAPGTVEARGPAARGTPPAAPSRAGVLVILGGICLPVITLLFELITHISADVLFNPIPSVWHLVLLAFVPVANLALALGIDRQDPARVRRLAHANAFALGISAIYAALYLPFTPFAMVGLLFWLLGLIPLTPLISCIATMRARTIVRRNAALHGAPLLPGLAAAILALGLPYAWDMATLGMLHLAAKSETREEGIRMLRIAGNRSYLLEQCYRSPRFSWHFLGGAKLAGVPQEEARKIFYRVTGAAYNTRPAPAFVSINGRRGWRARNWDAGLGGESVAGKVTGLTIEKSRLQGKIDAAAMTSYVEWTIVFKNIAETPSEARAQIELPAGAVVSRVTLWINGEEREAAFGKRDQVRAAYKEVAVQQRRDPVLVTTAAPDRILMQCFPVPASGGEMKVRLGITAPARVNGAPRAIFSLPRIIENNYQEADRFAHDIEIESSEPVIFRKLKASRRVQARLDDALLKSEPWVRLANEIAAADSWTEDPTDAAFAIRQQLRPVAPRVPARLAVVIDGSREMKRHVRALSELLNDRPRGIETKFFFAGDVVETAPEGDVSGWLKQRRVAGGRDNLAALTEGWDFAAASKDGAILWIHGSQPVLLGDIRALRDRLTRGEPPTLYDLPVTAGVNRITEAFDGFTRYENVRYGGSLIEDLRQLFAQWNGKAPQYLVARERIPRIELESESAKTNRHLARIWAREEVERLRANEKLGSLDRAIKLALEMQLVTPVSGAVVLETAEQYARHGLRPIDPATAPTVPEPGTAVLIITGLAIALSSRAAGRRERNVA